MNSLKLGIPREDINSLRGWLEQNKKKLLESIDRLFDTVDTEYQELSLNADIPSVSRQAVEFATISIDKYHRRLGKFVQGLTRVGEYLRDIEAVPTTQDRSYFNPLTKTLAIAISAVCFMTEDKTLHLNERELIFIYGHEGMGHAVNHVVSSSDGLPYFLRRDSIAARATGESLAQFYQNVIFEDIKSAQKVQRDLGIEHKFDSIYQEAKDLQFVHEYGMKLFQYGITVLADKSLGKQDDPEVMKKKIALLSEVSHNPSFPRSFVEQHRQNFDSQGNLNPQLIIELQYCARPVQRGLEEFAKRGITYNGEGRSIIDSVFLKGHWTVAGFVENARISADEYIQGNNLYRRFVIPN